MITNYDYIVRFGAKKIEFYYVICHIWPQFWYSVFKKMWKMQYIPIENYHVENAILGKDFNLGTIGSFFHVFTQLESFNSWTNPKVLTILNRLESPDSWTNPKVLPILNQLESPDSWTNPKVLPIFNQLESPNSWTNPTWKS